MKLLQNVGLLCVVVTASCAHTGGDVALREISFPVVNERQFPKYPRDAREGNWEGVVVVRVVVDHSGAVIQSSIVQSCAPADHFFFMPAKEAAEKWKFKPLPNGMEKDDVILTFIFRLLNHGAPELEQREAVLEPFVVEVRAERIRIGLE